uniref:Centriolin n=1 Tax=Naja naja TaxID=35670 RepID=A0A8C6XHL0_NAJNA
MGPNPRNSLVLLSNINFELNSDRNSRTICTSWFYFGFEASSHHLKWVEGKGNGSPGVRYITESLIKKLAKQETLPRITALNLSLDYGNSYIENLEKCSKLEVLNLSHNQIEKIEKLDKLLKLLDLNLSFNKISKIEGIEHLHSLQKLNLAGNEIEHLPVWLGKKLRSLRILNLRKNRISSLHEVAKLKPLKDLTSLFLADNPVVNLPHYRLYTIFHLRSLEDLEGQPVTNCDREEALERFNLEEVEYLEQNLEQMTKEIERLQNKQSGLLEQVQQQEEQNKSLKQKQEQQKQSHKDLETELETKNELLKQKTVELTRACQKQYELEQELAFYKIDAKFEPLGYYPVEDVEFDNVPGESPYIGKARYKRNMFAMEGYIPSKAQKMQMGNLEKEEHQEGQQLKRNLLQSLDEQLEGKERKIKEAQEKLATLHSEVAKAEQQVLKVTEELKQVQDAVSQKKVSEAEKDCFRQQLSNKIRLVHRLQEEALELERQMQKQRQEMAEKEKELEGLQGFLDSLDPKDPRHVSAHMKAQKASKEQQLDMMRRHYKQLESRLDDVLSRIANETEEIRDLEQQFCCKKHLRYAYEAELEAELKARDTEASQQKEELEKLKQIIQVEQSQLGKERQALENALAKAQLCEEKEQENNQLLSQLKLLQKDNHLLRQQLKDTQEQLSHTANSLIHPEEVSARVNELKQKLRTGTEIRCHTSKDILGKSLAELQRQFAEILARSQQETESAQARERLLQKEVATQRAELEEAQEKYKLACNRAAEAKIKSERRQNEARVQQLEGEIQHLVEKLKSMEEIQGLTDQQLQEADEEKDQILAELEDLENKKKAEDARAQLQFHSLSKELKALKEAISASDKQATAQLCAAKDQLQSLHGAVCRINRERSEELQEAEKFCMQATQAAKDLARAETEIGLLQKLLREKEAQVFALDQAKNGWFLFSCAFRQTWMDLHSFCERSANGITNTLRIIQQPTCLKHTESLNPLVGNRAEMEGILGEIEGLRRTISEQNDTIARFVAPLQQRHQSDGETLPSAAPCLLPPGSIIYTLLPDGSPVPQGTVLYGLQPPSAQANGGPVAPPSVVCGSPPTGVQLHYGLLPANYSLPLVPLGVLHCNIPDHLNLENDILRLEDSLETLRSQRHKDGSSRTSCEPNKEMEELNQGIQGLLKEKEELESQVAELQRVAQKRSKHLIEGRGDDLTAELELENSIQCHESIMDEIECVEKTLLKRRAELREADCLLAEAETELENTREKTKETIQKYNTAKQHLSHTEKEAEELERRTQEMAVRLVKADQELRLLQANAQDLQQHKMEQEGILKEINQIVSAKDSEFQVLSQKIEILTESLQKLQTDIQVAEGNEDHHLQILKEAENILLKKKHDLERLKDQTAVQQQELHLVDSLLDQKRNELRLLQGSIAEKKASFAEALRNGEAEITEKRQLIKEMKAFLEDLSVQKGELNAQLSEKRSQLSLVVQNIRQDETKLQDILGLIKKHKTELKHMLGTAHLGKEEVENLKFQHNQKTNELEKIERLLLEEKLELENLQEASQRQQGEAEHQRQLLQEAQQEAERLASQLHLLQNRVKALNEEKRQLEANCQSLEEKFTQSKRWRQQLGDGRVLRPWQAERSPKGHFIGTSFYRQSSDFQQFVLQHLREDVQHEEKRLAEYADRLKHQKQQLEQELEEQQGQLTQAVAKVQEMEERIRKLQKGECHLSALEEKLCKAWHQLSEKEQKLQEKVDEVSSLQRELSLSRAEERLLQDRLQADHVKAEKQMATLKETIKAQRAQLERALHEQKQENYGLQQEIASLEQVARENHQRRSTHKLKGTVKLVRLEVKDKMRNGLKDLSQSPPEVLEGREADLEGKGRLWNDVESLKENYPFTENKARMLFRDEKLDLSKVHITDEQWRGKVRREQLQHQEDRLKAQLRQCMSKQVEALIKGKQQTEGTLHSLRRQVDALDELVSCSSSTDSLFPSLNSSGFTDAKNQNQSNETSCHGELHRGKEGGGSIICCLVLKSFFVVVVVVREKILGTNGVGEARANWM